MVECRIIQDDYRALGQLWHQVMLQLCIKDFSMDIRLCQGRCQQKSVQKHADDIHPSARVPIAFAVAFLTALCISVGARHVVLKATFVNVNNGFSAALCTAILSWKAVSAASLAFGCASV